MDARSVLKGLGLNGKEISVYLALLETGESPVLNIAKKANIKRPTAYLVLQSLETKGFVSRVHKKRQTLFTPQHPKKLLTEAELRLSEMKEIVPQLEDLLRHNAERPRVMVYEGKDSLDRAYDDSFIVKGEVMFMSNAEVLEDVFGRTVAKYTYAKLSKEFRVREILDNSERGIKYASRHEGPYRQIRIMPKEFSPFATDVGTYGNTTLITSAKKEYFTVKIESEEIANSFRSLFEAMWQISKPVAAAETN